MDVAGTISATSTVFPGMTPAFPTIGVSGHHGGKAALTFPDVERIP